jgi:carbon monoxide dehydrogenase subunit G
MKILKTILIVIVVLVALAAIIGMFMSADVHVERSMEMKAAPDAVYNQVNNLKNWDNWMPWNKLDPNWERTWGEKTEGEGATYSWKSSKSDVGQGTITITKSVPNEAVETNLHFEGQGDAAGSYVIAKTDAGTKVTWGMNMNMGSNPFKRLMGGMMDKMMGPWFETGLKSLDSSAQANPMAPAMAAVDTTIAPADSSAMMK